MHLPLRAGIAQPLLSSLTADRRQLLLDAPLQLVLGLEDLFRPYNVDCSKQTEFAAQSCCGLTRDRQLAPDGASFRD